MDITQLLGSLSSEDMEKLQTAAAGLFKNMNENNNSEGGNMSAEAKPDILSGKDTQSASSVLNTAVLAAVGNAVNSDDDKIRFIEALKPLLSSERQKKADEAEKMLRLMSALPALKESGLLNGFI